MRACWPWLLALLFAACLGSNSLDGGQDAGTETQPDLGVKADAQSALDLGLESDAGQPEDASPAIDVGRLAPGQCFEQSHCQAGQHCHNYLCQNCLSGKDLNQNQQDDGCEIKAQPQLDCNQDGTLDSYQIGTEHFLDCNSNGRLDICESLDDCQLESANQYISYHSGQLPIVISAPHGGRLRPEGVPIRSYGTTASDTNTRELAIAISDSLYRLTGARPHLILCNIHRNRLDANREIVEAAQGNAQAEAAWHSYHRYIEAAKNTVRHSYGRGLYLDIHGLAASRTATELGYLLSGSQLVQNDQRLSHLGYREISSLGAFEGSQTEWIDLLRGENSLGALLSAQGYPVVPSPERPDPGRDDQGNVNRYFSGGYNTWRHGGLSDQQFIGLQIETTWNDIRRTSESRGRFAEALAQSLRPFVQRFIALDLDFRGSLNLKASTELALAESYPAELVIERRGDLTSSAAFSLQVQPQNHSFGALSNSSGSVPANSSSVSISVPFLGPQATAQQSLAVELSTRNLYGDFQSKGSAANLEGARQGHRLHRFAWSDKYLAGSSAPLVWWRPSQGPPTQLDLQVEASARDRVQLTQSQLKLSSSQTSTQTEIVFPASTPLQGGGYVSLELSPEGQTTIQRPFWLSDIGPEDVLQRWYGGPAEGGRGWHEHSLQKRFAELYPSRGSRLSPPGFNGQHLSLDGVDDVALLPAWSPPSDRGPQEWTLYLRFSAGSQQGFRYLYSQGKTSQESSLNIYLTSDGYLRTGLRGQGEQSRLSALDIEQDLRDGLPHSYALVVRKTDGEPMAEVYLDGRLRASANRGGTIYHRQETIFIGARQDLHPQRHFRGEVAELRLYRIALSETEVRSLSEGP